MSDDSSIHRIRLRGPWQFAWRDSGAASAGTMRIPEDWGRILGAQAGILELTRKFHAPSNLDADEAVFVVLAGARGAGEVRFNAQPLGSFTPMQPAWKFRLPRQLPRFNELTIVISLAARGADWEVGLFDEVALEIRAEGRQ